MAHPVNPPLEMYARMNHSMTSYVRYRIHADGGVTEQQVVDGVVMSTRQLDAAEVVKVFGPHAQ